MSFFFLLLSLTTFSFSHLWARRTGPQRPADFAWTQNFAGTAQQFRNKIERMVVSLPQLLILEKTPTQYIISESPSFFEYRHFYHFKIEENKEGLLIHLHAQAKLVEPPKAKVESFLKTLDEQDVS